MTGDQRPGPLALVGGAEWQEGCSFDRDLLELSGGNEVLILPTAAAYERPDKAVEWAQRWFTSLGADARGLMVLGRRDAEDEANAAAVREARFVYLGGGSPLHLRSVLKESLVWQALLEAWWAGAVVAGSSAGAMVLGDPMVDPRGGAFTLGLGLLENVAVLPHASTWSHDRLRRTTHLAQKSVALLTVDEKTAAIRAVDGTWRHAGAGQAGVFLDGQAAGLDVLPH
jgi:cyanophycinase